MPVKGLTQAEIDEATRAQVASGAKSTDRANRLPGETASEANARITAAYKEMTAKPVLSQEQKDAGMKVQFVRTAAGGVGEYVPIKPIGYTGPTEVKEFTPGVIPANSKYTTGTSVGFNPDDYKTAEDMQRVAAKVASGKALTADEQAFVNKGVTAAPAATPAVAPAAAPVAPAAAPAADAATAVRKLQSGQALTDAEKKLLGMSVTPATPTPTPTPVAPKKFTPAELQDIIRRLTRGEKLTPEEAAAVGVSEPKSIIPPGPTGTLPLGPTGTGPTGTGPTGTGPTGTGPTGTGPTGTGPTGTGPTGTLPVGSTFTASDGTKFTDEDTYLKYQAMLDEKEAGLDIKKRAGQSAYDLLYTEFAQYGMGSLVEPLKEFIQQGLSKSEFTIRLRETDAYRKRFAANAKRIANGYAAVDEATYISLEDQFQKIMQNYGMPESYYKRGDLGRQEGFEKLIAFDVDSTELEDRIMTAQNRVLNSNPEVLASLKQYYPEISNGDILAYALDPVNGKNVIKRKVTTAEIGGAAAQAGLGITAARAAELQAAGQTKGTAQTGFQTVAEYAPRGGQLAAMYGESPYTQQTAEQEVFGLAGGVEAKKQREKLKSLEQATFAGRSGTAQGALGRERSGAL